jgi:hypothetical protein
MKKTIEAITKKISKIYGVENFFKVEKLSNNKFEIRTELPSYEGGQQLSEALQAKFKGWICENQGGCVYILYKPL